MALDRARRRRERGEHDLADRELQNLRGTLGGTVAELRAILGDLSLEVLGARGLEPALRGHVERYVDITGKCIDLSYNVPDRLPGYLELLFYRLAQEALANVRKHSQAEQVTIALHVEANDLLMCISDDGVGFDVDSILGQHADGKHLGLRSMRDRVRAVGGDLAISSARGEGTTLRFWCPLPAKDPTVPLLPGEALAVAGH
jgi:signal transduction histidine kinase